MAYLVLFMVEKARSNNMFPVFSSYEWWIDSAKMPLSLLMNLKCVFGR